MRTAVRFGHEHLYILANGFSRCVAEDPFDRRIDRLDNSRRSNRNNTVKRIVQNRTQVLLAEFDPLLGNNTLLFSMVFRNQAGTGTAERYQCLDKFLVISLRPVGDPGHPDHPVAGIQGQSHKGIQGRMSRGYPAAAVIVGRVVGNDGFSGFHGRSEQGIQIAKFHTTGRVLCIKSTGGLIPGDVGNRVGPQIGCVILRVEHLSDETVLAAGQLEQAGKQHFERRARICIGNERRLGLADNVDLLVIPVKCRLDAFSIRHVAYDCHKTG